MSGIVGIVDRRGAPVDPRLVARMTGALRARGPDGVGVRVDGPVGLGHAWLRTTDVTPEPQPLGLDGRFWIIADARLDDRTTLAAELDGHGESSPTDGDAGLIVRAYRRWAEGCLEHLHGDFVFAIWDAARRRLFCARDRFGVKPFYYARTRTGLVFSNTLDCVRLHPDVSGAACEPAIGDFLLHGMHADPTATAFEAIRRLPAAHHLVEPGPPGPTRYWTLPVGGAIRYRRAADYVERFGELFGRAVADRLRCPRAAVLMSGGLDSTSVAATARRSLGGRAELHACTTICERGFVDPERHYAALAADALGMPIHWRVVGDYQVFERWDQARLRCPEPQADPLVAVHVDQLHDAAAHGRVVLTGYGGDPAFRVPLRYATGLLARGRVLRLAREVGQYVAQCRRLPRVRVRAHLRAWLRPQTPLPAAPPAWLDPDFAARLARSAREREAGARTAPAHPARPEAHALLIATDWPAIFESHDAGVTGVPVDVRHPFFDVRLVEYLLAIPSLPWCFDKTILRLAMRGMLPERVRWRPKTPAAGDAVVAALRRPEARWVDRFEPLPALHAYVRRDRVPPVSGDDDSARVWTALRPLCLNYWLAWQASGPPAGKVA
jgi:asparagine synthase (glutamine-hydrolysing)